MEVEQNISRLKYLLSSYQMTEDELMDIINENLKRPFSKDDVFSSPVDLRILKKIDKIFNKGIHFYLDPVDLKVSKEASIFFRKDSFSAELNIGAKKIVNQFEETKISLSAIAKLADVNISKRILPVFNINQNPQDVANKIRSQLYPKFDSHKKEFLRALISKLAENNILVFEFIETWNKIEKANVDGFFLDPNVIVLKREKSFSREIFTLIHELGHFLLNKEEVEKVDILDIATNPNGIERWCNDFSYYFLIGEYSSVIDNIDIVNASNDYYTETIENISKNTHLSKLALYTRLLLHKQISPYDYNIIKTNFLQQFREKELEEKRQRELDKQNGINRGGSIPVPINSPLLVSILQSAFYEGIIGEHEVCNMLNIKPNKLEKYLQ